ncbi:protein commissureless 2 homolog [Phlebotomus argentipes]|uniref:protein commissureless 2 homolog n=1 Tax=Phlebotomus argentipes TaxID=94469 RepID=UPI002892AF21|nr:protein commissureless 2 homolog [Phlebotomus argentipes]
MLDNFESKITFEIPSNLDFQTLAMSNNYTVLLTGVGEMDLSSTLGDSAISGTRGGLARDGLLTGDAEYDRFIGDVWVGILLTLMIVSSIFCMCACFLYHKFLQWKTSLHQSHQGANDNLEAGLHHFDSDSLPSYTLVSGLPSYDDALESFRYPNSASTARPSIIKLFAFEPDPAPAKALDYGPHKDYRGVHEEAPSYDDAVSDHQTARKVLQCRVPSYEEATRAPRLCVNLPRALIAGRELAQLHKVPSAGDVSGHTPDSPGAAARHNSLPRNFSRRPEL